MGSQNTGQIYTDASIPLVNQDITFVSIATNSGIKHGHSDQFGECKIKHMYILYSRLNVLDVHS